MNAADLPFSAARNMAVRPHCKETYIDLYLSLGVRTMHTLKNGSGVGGLDLEMVE